MGVLSTENSSSYLWLPFRKLWNCPVQLFVTFQAACHISAKNSCGVAASGFHVKKPGAGTWSRSHWDANLEGKTGNERLRKRQAWRKHHLLFPLLAWIDLAKNKTSRTPLWSRCIHRWPHRPSVTSDATCIIQPVFIYVEIELLSAKLWVCSLLLVGASHSVAVSCQLKHRSQNKTTLTDWWIRLHLMWHKHWQTNVCMMYRFHDYYHCNIDMLYMRKSWLSWGNFWNNNIIVFIVTCHWTFLSNAPFSTMSM